MAEHVSAEARLPARDDHPRQRRDALPHAPDRFTRVPALATRVVDRVGAGDAVLCVTALCAAMDAAARGDRVHRQRGWRGGGRDPGQPALGRTRSRRSATSSACSRCTGTTTDNRPQPPRKKKARERAVVGVNDARVPPKG